MRKRFAGPGYADIEAGRDIGPLVGNQPNTGIRAVGDLYNARVPHGSANISVLFGVANGIAWDGFAAAYLDPDSMQSDLPSFGPDLISAVAQYQADQNARAGGAGTKPNLTAEQAWAVFQTMPQLQRQAIIETAFFRVLQVTGEDYNDPNSPNFNKYARGYQAIETLFPSDLGYTKNNLEGGVNGAAERVSTGNLDIRGSTIQTEQGGNINIMGPGGQLLIGSTGSPPYLVDAQGNVLVGPQALGILAWETGAVNVFSDQSLLLAQSRIFTEQGGDMTIWSSNGDINAGNIQVQGTVVGVPHDAAVNIGALTNAANAATDAGKTGRSAKNDLPSIITVEVIGYGGGDGMSQGQQDERNGKKHGDRGDHLLKAGYNMEAPVQVLGFDKLNDDQTVGLTTLEKDKIKD
jgi:hypothetical protein